MDPKVGPWLSRFVPLLESLADGVLLVGRDGQVVFANEAAARLFGVPAADLTGPVDEFPARFGYRTLAGEQPPSVGTRALAGEVVSPVERRIRTAAGERGVRTSATPVRDDTGTVVGAVVLVGDVTLEQDEVARAHAETDRLQRAWREAQVTIAARQLAVEVLEHGDPMYVLDADFRYEFVNREWERLTGLTRGRVLGTTMWELFPASAEPASPIWVELHRCRRDGVPVAFEAYYAPLDVWLAHRAFPAEGGGLSVFLHDVSDRKRAELGLRRSEARLRRLYESGLFGVQHFDLQGRIVDANDAFLAMLGRSREEVEAGALDWSAVTPPEFHDRDRRALDALRRQGVANPYEKEYLRTDGTRVPVIVGEALLEEERDRGIAFVLDITEQRRARDGLVEADRRKNEFLGMLSHELRNPLAPIRNAIFMLRHAPADSPLAERALSVIERQTEQMAHLVDDLLDVTRISRGKIALRRAITDLRTPVRRTCEDQRTVFEAAGVELQVGLPADPVWAEIDEARIVQVLGNLLQNAAKFTPAGGRVTVALASEGDDAVLRVRDTGIGIPADELAHLFEPFVQGDLGLARTRGGLGLGLALARGLSALHGGSIRAASAGPNRGAEFTVTLPLARAAGTSAAGTGAAATGAPARPRTVLVIEDNLDSARTLADVLELQGHHVHVARNGTEGLALAREVRPDLVLCDIGLPDVDGYAVAREIRRDPEIGATPLIALSGYAQQEDRERSAQAGFDAHLPKPAPIEALEGLLRDRARSPG
jgi:PAS domain S-box-containing protein